MFGYSYKKQVDKLLALVEQQSKTLAQVEQQRDDALRMLRAALDREDTYKQWYLEVKSGGKEA